MQQFVYSDGALREVHDVISEMLKQLANEPSVGLYFVQQHVHKAVPALVSLKNQMLESTEEAEFVTQDVRDALSTVQSMKACGPSVFEHMIKAVDSSLPLLESLHRPRRRGNLLGTFARTVDRKDRTSAKPREGSTASGNIVGTTPTSIEGIKNSGGLNISDEPDARVREQVSAVMESPENATQAGEYSGYVRNMFDSALLKASNVTSVARWASGSQSKNLENNLTDTEAKSRSPIRSSLSEVTTDNSSSLSVRSVLGSALQRASSLRKGPNSSSSSSDGNASAGKESDELSEPGKYPFSSVASYKNPGHYVRAIFDSAMQTAGSVGRESSRILYTDGEKPQRHTPEYRSWLQSPSRAFQSLKKKEAKFSRDESLADVSVADDGVSTLSNPFEGGENSQIDCESYEKFAAEQEAKLEKWLTGT